MFSISFQLSSSPRGVSLTPGGDGLRSGWDLVGRLSNCIRVAMATCIGRDLWQREIDHITLSMGISYGKPSTSKATSKYSRLTGHSDSRRNTLHR